MADNWQFWDEDSAPNSRAHISNYGFGQSIYFDDSPGEVLGKLLESALNVHEQTGKTPAELATSLADAQAEIARLRGALEEINRTTFDDDANRIAHSALQK